MFLYLPHEIFSKTHTLRQMLLKLDCTGSQDEKQLKAKGGKRDPITSPLHQDKKMLSLTRKSSWGGRGTAKSRAPKLVNAKGVTGVSDTAFKGLQKTQWSKRIQLMQLLYKIKISAKMHEQNVELSNKDRHLWTGLRAGEVSEAESCKARLDFVFISKCWNLIRGRLFFFFFFGIEFNFLKYCT